MPNFIVVLQTVRLGPLRKPGSRKRPRMRTLKPAKISWRRVEETRFEVLGSRQVFLGSWNKSAQYLNLCARGPNMLSPGFRSEPT